MHELCSASTANSKASLNIFRIRSLFYFIDLGIFFHVEDVCRFERVVFSKYWFRIFLSPLDFSKSILDEFLEIH